MKLLVVLGLAASDALGGASEGAGLLLDDDARAILSEIPGPRRR